jgi:DNA adenine methylase
VSISGRGVEMNVRTRGHHGFRSNRPAAQTGPKERVAADYFDVPLLRYTGAKWQLADWLTEQFPPHYIYVEPFAGSGSVFFRKPVSPIEVLNDLDSEIVNFFRVLRERPNELIIQIDRTPFSFEEYEASYEIAIDPLERARRFYVRCWQAFGNSGVRKTGWRRQLNGKRGTTITDEWARLDGLYRGAAALKHAQIDQLEAVECIEKYDSPTTFFYCDPPYVLSSRSQGKNRKRYIHEMDDAGHRRLADALHQIKGMAMISGYDSPLYRELYADWRVTSKTTTTNGNSTATEFLWISPACDRAKLPLFAGVAV